MVAVRPAAHPRVDRTTIGVVAVNVALLGSFVAGVPLGVAALATIALPAGVAIALRPQLGVLLVVALLPYDGLLLIAPVPAIASGWKEAVVIATVLAAAAAPSSSRGAPGRPLPAFVMPIVLLGSLGIASAFFVGGLQGLYGVKVLLFFTLLAWAVWRCPLSRGEVDFLVGSLMVSGVATSTWGIAQQALGPDRLHAWGYEYNTVIRFAGGFLRSFSTFEEPFGYAYFLLVVLCIGLPVALNDPDRPRNRLFLLALPIVVLGMAVSVVRGALLGTAVLLVYLGFRAAVRRQWLLLAFPLALAALLVVPASVTRPALSSSSTGERTAGWTEIVPDLISRPFGAGVGTAGAVADKVSILQQDERPTYQPDNMYVLRAIELGPLGTILQVALLVSVFRQANAVARRRTGLERAVADGVAALTAAAAVASLISTYFEIFPADALWWTMAAIVATFASAPGTNPLDDEIVSSPQPQLVTG